MSTKDSVVDVSIESIRPYEKNPRRNEKAIAKVAESIKAFGFLQPIVCDADGVILAGHTRYAAARSLGLKTVPVLYARDLSDAEAREYRIADNRVGELARWDTDLLSAELEGIRLDDPAFMPKLFGFDTSDREHSKYQWKHITKACDLGKRSRRIRRSGCMSRLCSLPARKAVLWRTSRQIPAWYFLLRRPPRTIWSVSTATASGTETGVSAPHPADVIRQASIFLRKSPER